ncbi:MAG: hypothetical protein AMS18_15130 [Gemmatimonas sp. SG8_17]|nr:MAG: hypothetical protein AMS18_15130 [Gemmatimonas sp. SG8_17]
MAEPRFSIGDAVRFGWTTATANLALFLMAMVIVVMITAFPVLFDSALVAFVSWVLSMVVTLGIMRMGLRFVDGERGELADLFANIPLIVSYLIASIIVAIVATIGFLLLIIPGIYLALRLQFYCWSIIDKEIGPLGSVEHSWTITRGSAWQLFLFAIVLFFINILGLLALGVGLLVTIPLSLVAFAHVYRSLAGSTGS